MVCFLALWTIRLSMACYVIAIAIRVGNSIQPVKRVERQIWAAGAILCAIHVALAMAGFHNFSHADSIKHTAEVTRQVIGLNWGGGVYVNYLFTAVWGWDALRHFRIVNYRTPKWLHIFMAFIVVNATVVFGPLWWRYAAFVVVPIIAIRTASKPNTVA